MGIFNIAFIVLLIIKILDLAEISWLFVLSPLIAYFILIIALILIAIFSR